MSDLNILCYPDQRLRQVAQPVCDVDGQVVSFVDSMLESMYRSRGIGLAATQVNVHQRVVVMDVSETQDKPLFFINPEIVSLDGDVASQEGCLSVPDVFETVRRAEYVKVAAVNREGEPFELEAEGLLAVCIQHELDHLEGKLFIDQLSSLKRQRIRKKLQKMQASKVL